MAKWEFCRGQPICQKLALHWFLGHAQYQKDPMSGPNSSQKAPNCRLSPKSWKFPPGALSYMCAHEICVIQTDFFSNELRSLEKKSSLLGAAPLAIRRRSE